MKLPMHFMKMRENFANCRRPFLCRAADNDDGDLRTENFGGAFRPGRLAASGQRRREYKKIKKRARAPPPIWFPPNHRRFGRALRAIP